MMCTDCPHAPAALTLGQEPSASCGLAFQLSEAGQMELGQRLLPPPSCSTPINQHSFDKQKSPAASEPILELQ